MFYLSEYLERKRAEYYDRLRAISAAGDWNGWITFFLQAVVDQAHQNSVRVMAIQSLYNEMKQEIHRITRSQYTVHLLDALFNTPIFETTQLIRKTGIHKPTAMGLIRKLKEADILNELRAGSGRRPAVLAFPRLINIVEGRDVL